MNMDVVVTDLLREESTQVMEEAGENLQQPCFVLRFF